MFFLTSSSCFESCGARGEVLLRRRRGERVRAQGRGPPLQDVRPRAGLVLVHGLRFFLQILRSGGGFRVILLRSSRVA